MPFNFSGVSHQTVAKPGIVSDGELITVGADGYTVTSTLSSYSAFKSNPVRSAAGIWSVALKDSPYKLVDFEVKTVLAATNYLGTQLVTPTVSAGVTTLRWAFNSAGTPTDLPASGQFLVYVVYAETSIA
jgi:hypothetical protein